jgi:hypothetical protein
MAQCSFCGKDTQLYDNDVPTCLDCSRGSDGRRKTAVPERRSSASHQTAADGTGGTEGMQRAIDGTPRKGIAMTHHRLNALLCRTAAGGGI